MQRFILSYNSFNFDLKKMLRSQYIGQYIVLHIKIVTFFLRWKFFWFFLFVCLVFFQKATLGAFNTIRNRQTYKCYLKLDEQVRI